MKKNKENIITIIICFMILLLSTQIKIIIGGKMNQGFIKIFRKFISWEWYQDINTKTLFLHLLLKANYQESKWQGNIIKRGQVIIGLKSLNKELGLSIQQIRTSLNKLKTTQEITIKTTNKYSLITLVNYEKYQDVENEITIKTTNEQQTNNKQVTTSKEYKELKEYKNKEKIYKKEKYFDDVDLNDLFIEFLELRKKLKAVNSERAINSLLNKLNKHDLDTQKQMIEKSIINSWKDVYELKDFKNTKGEEPPVWFNKEIKVDALTKSEISEMEDLLNEFK